MSQGEISTGPNPGGSGTAGAGGGSQPISQFVIPPLYGDEEIEDWEPVFRAAVTPLLLRQDGQKLAIGLLPGCVNRRPAEVEIMKEVLKRDTLDAAFELLRTLDDPIDPYDSMQALCKAVWKHGMRIDDFYYKLKREASRANANFDLVCSIVIGQLPRTVKNKAKEFYAESRSESGITESQARAVLVKIKTL